VPARRAFVVALGGGVASGKSAAAERFAAHGVAVYDADVASRAVMQPGEAAYAQTVAAFGNGVVQDDGTLDRRALREIVFADPARRRELEAIVHPEVRRWLRERVDADAGPYCVLAIPLLAETWPQYAWVDRVAMVDVPPALQIARLMARDGTTRELAQAMLDAQATRTARLALAQDVIDNAGSLAALNAQIDALDARYRLLADEKRGADPAWMART
jgi:dephospho-CoA kinase